MTRRAAAGGSAAGGSRSSRSPDCPPSPDRFLETPEPPPPQSPDRPPRSPDGPTGRRTWGAGPRTRDDTAPSRTTRQPIRGQESAEGRGPGSALSLWLSRASLKVYPTPPLTSPPDRGSVSFPALPRAGPAGSDAGVRREPRRASARSAVPGLLPHRPPSGRGGAVGWEGAARGRCACARRLEAGRGASVGRRGGTVRTRGAVCAVAQVQRCRAEGGVLAPPGGRGGVSSGLRSRRALRAWPCR